MGSHNVNCKQLRNRHHCSFCGKGFMMEWAKNNCQKRCVEKEKAMELHPERYIE